MAIRTVTIRARDIVSGDEIQVDSSRFRLVESNVGATYVQPRVDTDAAPPTKSPIRVIEVEGARYVYQPDALVRTRLRNE